MTPVVDVPFAMSKDPMSDPNMPAAPGSELDELHQRVDAILDLPVAKESDAWPLPLTDTLDDQRVGYRSGSAASKPKSSWP